MIRIKQSDLKMGGETQWTFFPKADIQIAKWYMKRCSIIHINKEI